MVKYTQGRQKLMSKKKTLRKPLVDSLMVEEALSLGFKGECSAIRNFMKTANNWFKASCVFHDVCYTVGGTERNRMDADRGFYRRCLLNAASIPNVFKMWHYMAVATIWYLGVRAFGWMFFRYGHPVTVRKAVKINKAYHRKGFMTSPLYRRVYRKVARWMTIFSLLG
jgi:hypothetical protein